MRQLKRFIIYNTFDHAFSTTDDVEFAYADSLYDDITVYDLQEDCYIAYGEKFSGEVLKEHQA